MERLQKLPCNHTERNTNTDEGKAPSQAVQDVEGASAVANTPQLLHILGRAKRAARSGPGAGVIDLGVSVASRWVGISLALDNAVRGQAYHKSWPRMAPSICGEC